MNATDWIVLAAGVSGIALVNWWFFLAERTTTLATAAAGGIQEVSIAVRGGYSPGVIRVKQGQPVRLVFDRQETNSCSEEIVFPDFGIRRYLPANEKTTVEITPERAGTYEFMCGMSMLRGRIIAE
jgi:plastocyanin domain-containing protein